MFSPTHRDEFCAVINGLIFGGALGDALGGPIEFHKNLNDITSRFGPYGIQNFEHYYHKDMFPEMQRLPAGSVTDDTAMTLCTLEGYNQSITNGDGFTLEAALPNIWQAYLTWGAQAGRDEDIAKQISWFVDRKKLWSNDIQEFFSTPGAGASTLSVLSTGHYGTFEKPVEYDVLINGKRRKGPNLGCGAMMRTAPVAIFTLDKSDKEAFAEACTLAVTTHGHPDSYLSAAVINHVLRGALMNKDVSESVSTAMDIIKTYDGHENCLTVLEQVMDKQLEPHSREKAMEVMDALPSELGYKNKFLALPVLGQVIYALRHDNLLHTLYSDRFKHITRLAVNHSGDTDSVGSMCGQYMGAKYGVEYLPTAWMAELKFENNIRNIANRACHSIPQDTMESIRRLRQNTL